MENVKIIAYFLSCEYWNAQKGFSRYMMFKDNHVCSINHKGSSGSIKSKGIFECFQSSIVESFKSSKQEN